MRRKIIGIYQIKNSLDGKVYVGQSVDITKRWGDHQTDLEKQRHKNKYLQRVYNKHGFDIFEFTVLQELESDEEKLNLAETYWIEYKNAYFKDGGGYNMDRGGNNHLGLEKSEETCRKISEGNKGKKQSQEQIDKKRASRAGYRHSEETKNKMSLSRRKTIAIKGVKPKRIRMNSRKDGSSSRFYGLSFDTKLNQWKSCVYKKDGTILYLKRSVYEVEAALMRDALTLEEWGWDIDKRLNIIPQQEIDDLWNTPLNDEQLEFQKQNEQYLAEHGDAWFCGPDK